MSSLTSPSSAIHEDAKAGMYVEGLQEVVVSTAEATYGVFRRGSENRHVGMTAMNLESSRSHSVFTVVVESQVRIACPSHALVGICVLLVSLGDE